MIRGSEIVDEMWSLYWWVVKGAFIALAWTLHLAMMILFSVAQRLFHFATRFRIYIEQWTPVRPEIFEFKKEVI